MLFRLSFMLASAYVVISQRFFPTNVIIRWMRQPGHLRYAWLLSIGLFFAYAHLATWLDALPAGGTNGWLRHAVLVTSFNGLKFACAVVVWPLLGALRGLRQLASGRAARSDRLSSRSFLGIRLSPVSLIGPGSSLWPSMAGRTTGGSGSDQSARKVALPLGREP